MFGTMVDYWYYTGDDTYNDVVFQAMQHQVGDDFDYMPDNQTRSLGNDDQGFWTMTAMMAVESNFMNPPDDKPQWLALVQAVFNEYVERWSDETICGGGLRWQIFPFNNGYNYKNSISNGCFFNLASRLARYTGNQTYADWAEKVWDWVTEREFIDEYYNVFDGALINNECGRHDMSQWTYNAGIFLQGSAMMYNFTGGDERWRTRVQGLITRTREYFFDPDNIVVERWCEPWRGCNLDQQTFKGYLLRWMASTSQVAPFTFEELSPLIRANAEAAALQCSGTASPPAFNGEPGKACGYSWKQRENFDGLAGVGQQMSALSAVQYSLIKQETVGPVTSTTGGTSKGDVNAGVSTAGKIPKPRAITAADRVAATFLTSAIGLSVLGGCFFLMKEG